MTIGPARRLRVTIRAWSVYLPYNDDEARRWMLHRADDDTVVAIGGDSLDEAMRLAAAHGFVVATAPTE